MADKLIYCSTCGEQMAKKAKRCPHCGAKNKKPFYARFWFWLLALIALVLILSSASSCSNRRAEQKSAAEQKTYYAEEKPEEEETSEETENSEVETKDEEKSDTEIAPAPEKATEKSGLGSDFKQMMDSYEDFVDEYVAFCKKYADSDNAVSMLGDYATMMNKYADWATKIDALDEDEMTDEEFLYYTDVMLRCSQKMIEAAVYLD